MPAAAADGPPTVRLRLNAGRLTRTEAKWIVRLKKAIPALPPNWTYVLARAYLAAGGDAQKISRLDSLILTEPWASQSYEGGGPGVAAWGSLRDAQELLPFTPREWLGPTPPTEDFSYGRGYEEAMYGSLREVLIEEKEKEGENDQTR